MNKNAVFDNMKMKRTISMNLKGQFYDINTGEIHKIIDFTGSKSDTADFKLIQFIENSPYQFDKGVLQGKNNWQKYYEPALLITSLITVILLLYTQRI